MTRKVVVVLVLTVNLVLHAAGAPASVKLVRTPHYQFTPGYAILSVRVEPDARNRGYCLVYSGGDGEEGEQCRELDGTEAAPTQPELTVKDLSAGHYTAYVSLQRSEGDKSVIVGSNVVEWDVLDVGKDVP